MKKLKELLLSIMVVLVSAGLVWVLLNYIGTGIIAGANGVFALVKQISTLDTVLIIALISGSITVLGLVVNVIVSVKLKSLEYKNKAKAEMRLKMEKPYENFVNMIFDMLLNTKGIKVMSESEMLSRMTEFSKQVTLFGSNKVIKKWSSYRTSAQMLSATDNLKQLEGILFAIREDLGIKKRGMKTGDILSLFINDVKETIQKK